MGNVAQGAHASTRAALTLELQPCASPRPEYPPRARLNRRIPGTSAHVPQSRSDRGRTREHGEIDRQESAPKQVVVGGSRSQDNPNANRPTATSNASVSASHRPPIAIWDAVVRAPSQRAHMHATTRMISDPVKTLTCRAGKSPMTGARNTVRRVPWTTSAAIRSSHTARVRPKRLLSSVWHGPARPTSGECETGYQRMVRRPVIVLAVYGRVR